MAFLPSVGLLLALVVVLPFTVGQMGVGTNLQSMSYSIVNGKVFVDPPTTPAPTFMETWFPWLSSSYTSSNPEEIDEAIINSVTGPPEQQQSINLHQNSGMYSNYQQPQQQQPSGYNSYNQNQSPYLSNEEDNYLPSGSINAPQYVSMDGSYPQQQQPGYPNQNYIPSNQYQHQQKPSPHMIHYGSAPATYGVNMPPLPYPFSPLPGQPTTESSAPFYQPILDFFGYGSSSLDEQLSLPFPGGQFPSGDEFPSSIPSFPQSSFQFAPPQFAQARKSNEENTKYVDSFYDQEQKDEGLGKYSVHFPKSDSDIFGSDRKEDSDESHKENPCPKLGYWHWNGEVCIALGPVPIWACKPNDLVMSGRVGVCRNKIFFSPGTNPLLEEKK